MKNFDNFMKPEYLHEKPISKRVQNILNYWAKEAHEIDPSKSMSFYYGLFLKKFTRQSALKSKKESFFGENVIEN